MTYLKCKNPQRYYHSSMDLLAMAIWAKHGEKAAWDSMKEVCQDAEGLMLRVSEKCNGDPHKAIKDHSEALRKAKNGAPGIKFPAEYIL